MLRWLPLHHPHELYDQSNHFKFIPYTCLTAGQKSRPHALLIIQKNWIFSIFLSPQHQPCDHQRSVSKVRNNMPMATLITRRSTVRDSISFQDGGNHLYIWGIIRARNFHRVSVTVAPQWKWSRLFGHIYSNLCRCCREVFTGVESLDDTPCTSNAPYREKKGRCSNSHICSYKYRTPSSKTHPSIGI